MGGTIWNKRKIGCGKKNQNHTRGGLYFPLLCCNEKLYLFSTYAIVVIDIDDTFSSIKFNENKYVSKSLREAYCFADYHVESCGEIFLVRKICLGGLKDVIRTCDVYELDFSTMGWTMVESICGRIFLLGQNSASVPADEYRGKGNQIYFTQYASTNLYRFDMDDGTITSSLPCPKTLPHWRGPYWVVPNYRMSLHRNVSKIITAPVNGAELIKERSWKNLQKELLQLILSSISGADVIRFRLTCKAWTSIHAPLRPNPVPIQSSLEPNNLPWLMSLPRINKDLCNFYHPIYSDSYFFNTPKVAGAIIRDAKYGWLLMSQGIFNTFFFNPLTEEIIKLPDLQYGYRFVCISFSSPPTSMDCTVLGHMKPESDNVYMVVYRRSKDDDEDKNTEGIWSVETHYLDNEVPYEFIASESNPVFYNGFFYCLSKDGKLGCFDPKKTEDDPLLWRILPVPPFFAASMSTMYDSSIRSFIMEYGGEIWSVFVDHLRSNMIRVYRLDWLEMKWVQLHCLGDNVIFVSPTRSILLRSAGLKGIHNRIYFPMFREDDSLFYSLSTGNYHCFGNSFCRGNWIGTSEHWNCTWIQFHEQVTKLSGNENKAS